MNKIVPGEQNSPRYSGDYPVHDDYSVHVHRIVPGEQDSPRQSGFKLREQDSPR